MKIHGDIRNVRVLILSSNLSFVETLCFLINGYGYKVEKATSISMAKTKMERRPYDLLLIDDQYDDSKGLEKIKEINRSINSVIILCTSLESRIGYMDMILSGIDNFLLKPFKPVELYNILQLMSYSVKPMPTSMN